ncbi:hypothetical protein OPIT5_20095 [Opitutaceae bacterium TAV5]|nr:hypothetical protein OPIT5_20095 [Opitutaceae bacterium TAV5]
MSHPIHATDTAVARSFNPRGDAPRRPAATRKPHGSG